ncbi:uncharacterized protein GIQ15_05278 [Arthroderma uncinatum]|uniref:uncharacterized protein n=1 Tax=Arthroderma uncinatum TaxID=74035 RepID=UPI00144A805D|nr:uncharacterized protein GIQ15_05278 [Arthroderma uncinatum]KAF3482519.1 hypothetical protein GIQ15_05278 [Arthroderma uncinatum]
MKAFVALSLLLSPFGSSSPVGLKHEINAPEQIRVGYFEGDTFYSPPFAPPRPDSHEEEYEAGEGLISDMAMPDWPTTHLLARRLLALSSTGILSTVFPKGFRDPALAGVPVGLPDYIADCSAYDNNTSLTNILGRGNPLILALNVGTSFRNTRAGSRISLSIDWWQHLTPPKQGDDPLDHVPAALPRLALIGHLEEISLASLSVGDRTAIEKCFLAGHPDSKNWLPGSPSSPHSGYWARLVVEKALWVGGFGDRARIGWLDMDVWKVMKEKGKDGEKGWADVKLPGEQGA